MNDRSRRIADLNDAFRQSLELQTGQVLMTHGVSVLPPQERLEVFSLVKTFNAFNEDNDPYGEHDFGKIDYNGNSFFLEV